MQTSEVRSLHLLRFVPDLDAQGVVARHGTRILKGVHEDGVLGSGELAKFNGGSNLEATRNRGLKSAAG